MTTNGLLSDWDKVSMNSRVDSLRESYLYVLQMTLMKLLKTKGFVAASAKGGPGRSLKVKRKGTGATDVVYLYFLGKTLKDSGYWSLMIESDAESFVPMKFNVLMSTSNPPKLAARIAGLINKSIL